MEGKKVNSLTYYYNKLSKSSEGSEEEIKAFNMLDCYCLSLIEKTENVQDIGAILGFAPSGGQAEKIGLEKTKELSPIDSEDDGDYDSLSNFISRSFPTY